MEPQILSLENDKIMKKLDYQPTGLTNADLENPFGLIADFYDNNKLHETREKLWQLYRSWVGHSTGFAEGEENADMLYFYTQLIDLMNACYIYTEKKKLSPSS